MKYYKNELYHHGILGQKWGRQNGPPYPLKPSAHSASEKKAGWKKSLNTSSVDTKSGKSYTSGEKKGLSDKQKQLIKIGATVAVAGLTAYGGYKLYQSGAFDSIISRGKESASFLSGDKDGIIIPQSVSEVSKSTSFFPADHIYAGLPQISGSETASDTLRITNPFKGSEGRNNCVYSAVAGFLRSEGVDVTARQTPGGQPQNGPGVAEEVFRALSSPENRRRILEGSATTFGKSREDAERMLKKRFGDNAKGFVNVEWKDGAGGHAFNFEIVNGKVSFMDYRFGLDDAGIMKNHYWDDIDTNGNFSMIRLDGLAPNRDSLDKINEIRK